MIKKKRVREQRDDSVVKRNYWFFRGPEFGSCHSCHVSYNLLITPTPGDPLASMSMFPHVPMPYN